MRYVSTRGRAAEMGFSDVLLSGLASDGGLYVPAEWPQLTVADLMTAVGPEPAYADVAIHVMWPFVEGDIDRDVFEQMVRDAYATFDHELVIPLTELGDGVWLMELFHGPTLAFKDVALQLVGRLFDHVLGARGQQVTIVGATSGDTGSAAIDACQGRDAIDIVILHPYERTSEIQRRQMTTATATNVHNVAIEGTFDDCQDIVKAMFADVEFRDDIGLSAVNSINWARVMAQVVYYWWAAVQLGRIDQPISFAVPTGNFGNVFAGEVARRMGLPIAQFVVGSNHNDILARFFETGEMRIDGVEPSLSPSMDIQVSSNFERLLFEMYARDGEVVADLLTEFRDTGVLTIDPYRLGALRETWDGIAIDDARTTEVISEIAAATGEVLDPHTAVGVGAASALRRSTAVPMVCLGTAHPAKFPDAVRAAVGHAPGLPERLQPILTADEHYTVLANDLAAVKAFVRESSRWSSPR